MAGQVRVDGAPADKPGTRVSTDARVTVAGEEHPYVSRGGVKLEAALRALRVDVRGLAALDIDVGASTGGFTDCLLQHGAARVVAVDVGYGQLAWRLRNDPRVAVLERTNIRHLPAETAGPVDLVVVDVSFIGLTAVLREAVRFLRPGGRVLALVKPQFEAGRAHVRRGGRVTDPAIHAEVLDRVFATGIALGLLPQGHMPSPVAGRKSGNVEYLVLWRDARRAPAESPPRTAPVP